MQTFNQEIPIKDVPARENGNLTLKSKILFKNGSFF